MTGTTEVTIRSAAGAVLYYGHDADTVAIGAHERLNVVAAAIPGAIKSLRNLVDLISEDGHRFHDGTEMGRRLNQATRALKRLEVKADA